jgi:hypothetical protein
VGADDDRARVVLVAESEQRVHRALRNQRHGRFYPGLLGAGDRRLRRPLAEPLDLVAKDPILLAWATGVVAEADHDPVAGAAREADGLLERGVGAIGAVVADHQRAGH